MLLWFVGDLCCSLNRSSLTLVSVFIFTWHSPCVSYLYPGFPLSERCVYLFLTAEGLCSCAQGFSSCGVQASHCRGLACWGAPALEHRLISCEAPAYGPGVKPMSPALAGRFLTSEQPGMLSPFYKETFIVDWVPLTTSS